MSLLSFPVPLKAEELWRRAGNEDVRREKMLSNKDFWTFIQHLTCVRYSDRSQGFKRGIPQ
ncbi:MAG: hypothetical protein WCI23_09805 [Chlorobiaceae bacterium]